MEDVEMTDGNDLTRPILADEIPGIDAPYFFYGPCQGRRWLDCDYRQRTENQRRGPTHPDWDPGMVLPCSNCRFHGGGTCNCTPTVQTMRESLQASMSREPSHKANTPKARRDNPMRETRISALWQGTSNPTPPDLPQDIFPPPPPQKSPPPPLYPWQHPMPFPVFTRHSRPSPLPAQLHGLPAVPLFKFPTFEELQELAEGVEKVVNPMSGERTYRQAQPPPMVMTLAFRGR